MIVKVPEEGEYESIGSMGETLLALQTVCTSSSAFMDEETHAHFKRCAIKLLEAITMRACCVGMIVTDKPVTG